ncbi:class IV adenylate cyclase [Yersinia kristensenii]|uniref:class IV adenylate cyclase n=1 Tax=Yersinia kristensenii TaxID=28152 RepID=UPI0001A54079|nr:class IV adenylate cyclase [Yersinia kristensenii]EEP90708.1 Adenylate cyclase, class 2 (thermophilic) [Yersinia kristensenii ATCC 33638]MBW5811269.1 class IV adenylate cyclase [Yersinia kristensenii]MBW5814701.1 class IV adenylate cyclase [Yersinia kristensenii]MBW5824895.1 class IV adenylate cyclase [Yersinia kristensenii]MBW5828543.1 class IV adenylate cyclase [Yersinia kristensenii]
MSEHFVGKYEVELKFKVSNINQLHEQLTMYKAVPFTVNNHEKDIYLEVNSGDLAAKQISMLLREMNPSGIRLWIVKGPGTERCEASNIEDIDKVKSMLSTLGYQPAFTLEKQRSIYFIGKFHVTVDSLAELGDFAEIAIMTDDFTALDNLKAECRELANGLGLLVEQQENRSYRQLLGF